MKTVRHALALAVGALMIGSAAAPASAALLEGNQLRYRYLFPTSGSNYDTQTITVGAGAELPSWQGYYSLDVSDQNIFIDYQTTTTWNTAEFNGFELFDINGTVGDITSVTINAATNMVGLDASRISFDANTIRVNWNGLSFTTNTIVSLDINGTPVPTPEPAALGLLGLGIMGIAGARRRKK